MSNNNNALASRGGIGCFTILGLILITLKLAEIGQVATWSWWWVLAPFWVPVAIDIIVFLIILIATLILKGFAR